MKNTKYHTDGTGLSTVAKSLKVINSRPLAHTCMAAHFPRLVHTLQSTIAGIN